MEYLLPGWPGLGTACRHDMFDRWLVFQHKFKMWVLTFKKIKKITHEVVNSIGLITFTDSVQINGCFWESQGKPL